MHDDTPRTRRLNGTSALRRWHLYLGLAGALWLLWLIGSGVVLEHAARLGLDRRYVQTPWLLRAYGLTDPAPLTQYAVGSRTLAQAGERLYLNGKVLDGEYPPLVGAVALPQGLVAVGADTLLLLTPQGRVIESAPLPAPPAPVRRAGSAAGRLVVEGAGAVYAGSEDLLTFTPIQTAAQWAAPAPLDEDARTRLIAAYHAGSISYARLLQDLHSARFFGPAGPLVADALALLLAAQVLTGLWLALPGRRRQ